MIPGFFSLLALSLVLWQWLAARRFPLHQRLPRGSLKAPVTLLKPLKGCDDATESCLRSWLQQDYQGPVQLLLAVASADDPVCGIVRKLFNEFPEADAQLIVCGQPTAANAKIWKLAKAQAQAAYDLIVISDADVRVPPDLLTHLLAPLVNPETGLVHCFYRLQNPSNAAMHWEAVAINADFWSQVLQARDLGPVKFALGAVMATRKQQLAEIGGLEALTNCLADDYQLGNRIASTGSKLEFANVVVECWSAPMTWRQVWKHQLRWARTIRVCQPLPYFFSILSNGTLFPCLWLLSRPSLAVLVFALALWTARVLAAMDLQKRLMQSPLPFSRAWLVPVKDLLQVCIWAGAFGGNRVEWRGEKMRLRRDGSVERLSR